MVQLFTEKLKYTFRINQVNATHFLNSCDPHQILMQQLLIHTS